MGFVTCYYGYVKVDILCSYSRLQTGWQKILRSFLHTFNLVPCEPRFSWDLSLVMMDMSLWIFCVIKYDYPYEYSVIIQN